MGARQVWVVVVAAAFLIAMGNTSADHCQDVGVRVPSVTIVMDSPAESNEPGVHLNASVEAPNLTAVFMDSPAESNEPGVHLNASVEAWNSTVVFMGPSGSRSHVCFTPDSAPFAATPAPVPRPPPEPEWPDVTSLATDFLSSSSVKVYWTTNVPTVGRVVWGPLGHSPSGTAESEVFATEHAVWVHGLTPGETYALHIIAFDGRAHAELSDSIAFMTPPPPRDTAADALLVAASVGATLSICYVIWRRTP